MTWPIYDIIDIKNLKYTNCRYLCPYCVMRVSKSSDHWCAFGKMSNFEKRSLRSGHLMQPGHVTFRVIGSSFFRQCVILLAEQLWQIWRRYAPPFFRYLRKTVRGGWNQPPAGARDKLARSGAPKLRGGTALAKGYATNDFDWGGGTDSDMLKPTYPQNLASPGISPIWFWKCLKIHNFLRIKKRQSNT